MITISGVSIPTPSDFTVGIQDIVGESKRNANGYLIAERIAIKRKIELSWKYLSNSDLSTLLSLFNSNFFVTVRYPDPQTGAMRTGTFYVGDRSVPALDYIDGVIRWKDIKFNLIER